MKVYIQTDIEGVAGVVFYENHSDTSYENVMHRQRMYRLLTGEVNAAVKAAFDSGAEAVLVNDSHSSGYNILFEELDERCEIIHGRNCSGPHWLPDLKEFDVMLLVGMHAMGGTGSGVLQHSRWSVNNDETFMSEGAMAAALAGDLGIPTVFASGDDKITAELAEKIPEIKTATVKKALSVYQARSLSPEGSRRLIYETVSSALKNIDITPYRVPGPLTLNLIESVKGTHDESAGHKKLLPEAVEAETISEAFEKFLVQMPWINFNVNMADGFEYPGN